MKKIAVPIALAFLILTATVISVVSIPVYEAHSQALETETFVIPVQKDSFLTQGSQKNNEGANVILNIKSSDKHRPVIAFDTDTINSAVDGRPLQSAVLRLYITENGNNWGSDGNTIGVHRLLADWHEGNGWNVGNNIAGTGSGVTWGCAIDTDISNNLNDCSTQWDGGSFQSTATSNVLITNNLMNQWVEFNVTSDVLGFLNGTSANYGWIMKKTSESMNGDVKFPSRESGANSPVLEITVIRPEFVLANKYLALIEDLDQTAGTFGETAITTQTIESINATLREVEDTVVQLQHLGFDGYIRTDNIDGQIIGTVKFNNSDSSQALIETQIPRGTLGIFMAMSFTEGLNAYGAGLNSTQIASLLNGSSVIIEVMTAAEHEPLASDLVLGSIGSYHPSEGNTVYLVVGQEPHTADSYFGKLARDAVVERVGMGINNPGIIGPIAEAIDAALNFLLWDLYPYVEVEGLKFNDLDANGARDDPQDEPGLGNFTFRISTTVGLPSPIILQLFRQDAGGPAVKVSNSMGHFEFSVRVSKFIERIVIVEEEMPGWEVTTPAFGLAERSFTNPGIICNPLCGPGTFEAAPVQFGNFKLGEISGIKFLDDGDGIKETGEPGIANWTIVLKNATNGATLETKVTDTNGFYSFTGLVAGIYRIEEEQQEGYTQRLPTAGYYEITVQSGTNSTGNNFGNQAIEPIDVIWYGADSGAVNRLRSFGFDVETRSRPVSNLDATVVVIATGATGTTSSSHFTSSEVSALQSFVSGGGRLIFAIDTDYFHCNPDSNCAAEVSKNFGFGFDGDVQTGSVTPASGQSNHPIWRTPNTLTSFTNWCCDAYVKTITDSNVLVLGRVSGSSPEQGEPTISVSNVPAIVVNQNPAFNGGKVMGIGYNMFVGISDFRMFDNIMTFLLGQTVGGAPGGPYHYVEVNQTSANVTRPDSVTIEVEVEWYNPYWSAQPVEITLGNMTGTNITYSIQSIYNTTEYQVFEITFNLTEDVQPGVYAIPIVVRDLEDGYIEQADFVLYVE
jgi:hypothetical protein